VTPKKENVKTYYDWKQDAGKSRWSLLPWKAVAAVVDVLEYGAKKYSPESWRGVPDARVRYYDATMRHLHAWWGEDERNDAESGLPHLAHACCCVVFLLALELETSHDQR
jgi:hypothetical protein